MAGGHADLRCGWGSPAWCSRVSNSTGWVFICQGKTKTMFRWGVYGSATTIAAFIVGLPWGAVGVAAAYAISGYALRIPVLAVLMHRTGPVSAYDFLSAQILFVDFVRRHVGDLRVLPEILCGVERPTHRSDGDGAQLCACRPAGAGIP